MSIDQLRYAPDAGVTVGTLGIAPNSPNSSSVTYTFVWSGAGDSADNRTSFQRIGDWVTVAIEEAMSAIGNEGSPTPSVPIPQRFWPTTSDVVRFPWIVDIDGKASMGDCFIDINGSMGWGQLSGDGFAASAGKTGPHAGSGSYFVG
jgi:hypothetical protein